MSKKLVCPFCQQELEDANIHSSGLYFECPNCYGKQKEKDDNYTATPKVWQELIRTREALDVAVGQLKKTRDYIEDCRYQKTNYFLIDSKDVSIIFDGTNESLEKITALEQKDAK